MRILLRWFVFFLFAALCSDVSGANRVEIPGGVYYHRFTSSVSGIEAAWINPAALGYDKMVALQLTGELYQGNFADNWGITAGGDGVGISYRHLADLRQEDYDEYIFSAGVQSWHGIFLGGSYRYVKNGPEELDKKHFWSLGFLIKQNPRFALAGVFYNLNRSRVDGRRSDIEQIYSISHTAHRGLLTISAEVSLSTAQSLKGAAFRYGVDVNPLRGVIINVSFDNRDNYEAGFRINLARYFLGEQTRLCGGNVQRGTSIFGGIAAGPQESILPRSRR
ncbi:MAG: hypothetical protein JSU69_09600 [Candidatus Zixiibacteriota bacterium]|nr:MAG: hypothetical protein JSU69_09600 [candidate division Zixibacteria bacterium]